MTTRSNLATFCFSATISLLVAGSPTNAQEPSSFFRGKNINLIIPYNAGGGYDGYARLAGRFFERHVPGKPRVVAQNKPGAGGLTGAKFLATTAPKDGTYLGIVPNNVGLRQLLNEKNLGLDARELNWVGRLTSSAEVYYTWHTSPTKTFADLRKRETVTGGSGGLSNNITLPLTMNALLGTKIKLIRGFRGSVGLDRALEGGEVEMVIKPWQALKSGRSSAWLRDKQINLIVQFSRKRQADLQNVPSIFEFVKSDEHRRIFAFLTGPGEIGRSLALPPGVPADRVKALRVAFDTMTKDPAFHEEARKLHLDIDTLGGTELQEIVKESLEISPEVVAKVRKIIK